MGQEIILKNELALYLYTALGVAASLIIPLIRNYLPIAKQESSRSEKLHEWWLKIRPYLALALISLLMAVFIMAVSGDQLDTWAAAFLAGYGADSTIQKFGGR
jgi:hypothetical protein